MKHCSKRVSGDERGETGEPGAPTRGIQGLEQSILDTIPDPAWVKDPEGRFLLVNTAWCNFVGVDSDSVIGRTAGDIFPPEFAAPGVLVHAEIMESGTSRKTEEMMVSRSGSRLWFETFRSPFLGREGGIAGTIGIARNISKCKATQDALETSDRKFATLFTSSPDAIVLIAADADRVVEVNPAANRLCGYSNAEMIGRTLDDLALWSRPEQRDAYLHHVRGGSRVNNLEAEFRRKNGTLVPCLISGGPVELESAPHYLSVIRDVSDLRRQQELLKVKDRAIDCSLNAMAIAGLDGCITYVNAAFVRLWGLTDAGDAVGKSCLSFWKSPTEVMTVLETMLEGNAWSGELTARRASGEDVEVEVFGTPVRDSQGGLLCILGSFSDVSIRRRAQQARRESERKFAAVFEHAPIMMTLSSLETGTYIDVNKSFERISGFSRGMAIGRTSVELGWISAEDRARLVTSLKQKGQISGLDMELRTATGRIIHGNYHGIVIELSPCPVLLSLCIDITDRRRREHVMASRFRLLEFAATHTLDELLRATLDEAEELTGSKVGFYHFLEADQNTLSLQAWSTRTTTSMCTAQGAGRHYPVAEAGVWVDCIRKRQPVVHNDYASLPHRKGLPPGHAPVIRELVVPVIRLGKIKAILGIGNKAGDYNDDDVAVVGELADLAWDIAERKRSEEEARKADERVRDILETTGECVWEIDASEGYNYISGNCRAVYGREANEMIGKTPFDFMAAGEAARTRAAFREVAAAGKPFTDLENDIVHVDGTVRHLLTSGVPRFDAQGVLKGYRGIDKDLTELRRAEEKFRQAQKMEAVGQLAGGVAHDFNNILASVLMHIGILQQETQLPPDIRESLREMGHEAKRAAALTRQLLLYSRRSVMQVRVIDLNGVVEDMTKMLRRLLGEQIEFRRRGSVDPVNVEADAGMIEQVLMNLCVNARDAMPQGGVLTIGNERLTVAGDQVSQHPDAREGAFACLTVQDSGCGMDEKTVLRVFEPFFTTKDVGKGTGLGLATVDGIVKQHRGWVEVRSTLGVGTTFKVFLPAATSDASSQAQKAEAEPIARGKETLLYVEDDLSVRYVVATFLRRLGYRVLVAGDAAEAVEAWRTDASAIALLLTDMVMSNGMTGLQLAERLRAENPRLPVIISSGYSADLVEQASVLGNGIVSFPKPCDPSVLADAVRDSIDRSRGILPSSPVS